MTDDEELIEQVARAICDADQWCGLYDRLEDDERSVYQRDARAILPIIKADRAQARAELVAEIVAWLRGVSDPGATFQDRRLAYQLAAVNFADAIEAGEPFK